jgi:hypothetical protein
MYTRPDVSLEDRMEIFSRHWRYGDERGATSELADEWGVSRRFIYDLRARVREAIEAKPAGRRRSDRSGDECERLRMQVAYLEADCETLRGELAAERHGRDERRFRLLMELAMAPVSEDKIARCLGAAFDRAPSSGWVHAELERAGEAALRIMNKEEVREALTEAALDEIFAGRRPILTIVDPATMMAVVPEAAEDRKGETWGRALDAYPNLSLAISDQGSGLLKGVELRGGVEHQADLFHIKRSLRRELRRLERGCYECMEEVETARRLVERERLLESARVQARIELDEKTAALDRLLSAFDWTELIVGWVEEQTEVYDTRRQRLRTYIEAQRVVDEALELLAEVDVLDTSAVSVIIKGARAGLFTFLQVLERRLASIDVRWRPVTGPRAAMFSAVARVWHEQRRASGRRRDQERYLTALSGLVYWSKRTENLSEVIEQVFEAIERVVRASSAVESFNSILRPYASVKKRLSQRYLALVAFYWNTHRIAGRGKRTPFEQAGVDLGSDDWVELLEVELRRMATESTMLN